MQKFICGDLVKCTAKFGKDCTYVVIVYGDHNGSQRYILKPTHGVLSVSEIMRAHDRGNCGEMLGWVDLSELDLVEAYDPQEEEFICCGKEMSPTGEPGYGNVFKCKTCGYFEVDVAAAKLDGTFDEPGSPLPVREYTYWLTGDPPPTEWPRFYQWQNADEFWINTCGSITRDAKLWHLEQGGRRRWQKKLQDNEWSFKDAWMGKDKELVRGVPCGYPRTNYAHITRHVI